MCGNNKKGEIGKKTLCAYFKACKSTYDPNNFKAFPKPAKREINIEFIAPENRLDNTSSHCNINGAEIKSVYIYQ